MGGWLEVQAKFSNEDDAKGYVVLPVAVNLDKVASFGGPEILTIKMDDLTTVYVCESPLYEQVARRLKFIRFTHWFWQLFGS